MRWTNQLGIPDILYRALIRDEYSRGDADYSITQLLKPVQAVALERAHEAEIVKDAAEAVQSVFGRATHHIIQQARGAGRSEERLYATVGGCRVSGQPDYEQDGWLHDWKTVKWLSVVDGPKPEWEAQLNGYALLYRLNQRPVVKLSAWALLKDWSKDLPNTEPRCPKLPLVRFDLPVWPESKALAFFQDRVWQHEGARRAVQTGTRPTPCTIDERWGRGEHWAAIKPGAKRATKKFYAGSAEVATWIAQQKSQDYEIVHRPAVYVRCRAWCDAAPWCPTFRDDPGGGADAE